MILPIFACLSACAAAPPELPLFESPSRQGALDGLTVKPAPRCLGPRLTPDRSIPPPVVESAYPPEGAVVRPGILVVRLTFNVAMSCNGIFLKLPPMEKPCGEAAMQEAWLSYDRRTIRMKCMVSPNRRYGYRLNSGPDPSYDKLRLGLVGNANFISLAGLPLKSFKTTFTTSGGPRVTDIREAEAQDKDAPPNAPELAASSR